MSRYSDLMHEIEQEQASHSKRNAENAFPIPGKIGGQVAHRQLVGSSLSLAGLALERWRLISFCMAIWRRVPRSPPARTLRRRSL